MNINLKKKLLLIIGISSLFVVLMDVLFGNFMFDKITDYWKVKSLSNLNFIFNNGTDINQKGLDEYQRHNNAQVIAVGNNNILNLYDYCFGEIETDRGEKITILLGSLLESNRRFELSKFEDGERIEFQGVEIFKNYYVPLSLEINNNRYSDDKLKIFFGHRERKGSVEKTVSGKLMNLNYFHDHTKVDDSENLYLQSKFLQVLSAGKFNFGEIFIFDKSRVQILKFQKEELTIFVFYQYENLTYVQDLISSYNLYKIVFAFIMFLVTILALKIMVTDPILDISESIKKIARGEKISLPQQHSKDEIGELFRSVEKLNDELYEVIKMYRESYERNNNIFMKIMEQTRIYMHEVRNPLSLILGYSTIAIEDLENRELEEMKESLEIIENAAETLAILTKRDFSLDYEAMDVKLILSEFSIVNLVELVT